MKEPDHSTATTTGGLPTIEQAMKGAAEADAMTASALAGMVYGCSQAAIDQLAMTGDPHWAEAAAHLVTALFEIGEAGRPVEADEPVAVEQVEPGPGPTPESTLEKRLLLEIAAAAEEAHSAWLVGGLSADLMNKLESLLDRLPPEGDQ